MTTFRPYYYATLIAGAAYPLQIIDGSVTMDESRWPHIEADLQIAIPSLAVAALIDPRANVTVSMSLNLANDDPALPNTSRPFALWLRSREIDHKAGVMRLTLASEEARLNDYINTTAAPFTNAFQYQSSLRDIINNVVLSKISRTLEPGTADATFNTLSDSTNLVTNPKAGVNLTDVTGGNATILRSNGWIGSGITGFQFQSPTATENYFTIGSGTGIRNGMSAGGTYTVSGDFHITAPQTGTLHARARSIYVLYTVTGGAQAGFLSSPAPNTAGRWRVSMTFTLPANTTDAVIRFYNGATAGGTINWTYLRLSAGAGVTTFDAEYFDGSTPNTSEYAYAWTGTANNTTSTRVALIDRSPDLLYWPPGMTAWEFVQPLFQAAGLRLFCDENFDWFLVDDDYIADGLTSVTVGMNAIEASDLIDRDGGDWFDSVIVKYTWTANDGTEQVAYDRAVPGGSTKPKLFEINRPNPGPGFAAYVLARAEGKGRQLELSTITNFLTQPSQPVIATLPDTPIQTGVVSAVTWNLGNDEMRITTRGLTNTPPDSYVFGDPADTYLDVPVGMTYATFDWSGI